MRAHLSVVYICIVFIPLMTLPRPLDAIFIHFLFATVIYNNILFGQSEFCRECIFSVHVGRRSGYMFLLMRMWLFSWNEIWRRVMVLTGSRSWGRRIQSGGLWSVVSNKGGRRRMGRSIRGPEIARVDRGRRIGGIVQSWWRRRELSRTLFMLIEH